MKGDFTVVILASLCLTATLFMTVPAVSGWMKTYMEVGLHPRSHGANSIVQTLDGGYALAGVGFANLVKTDANGNRLWNASYREGYVAYCVIQTNDLGFALAGGGSGVGVPNLVKTDVNGNQLWARSLGVDCRCIVQTSDGGYALTGGSYLIKTDANGRIQWTKTYGGASTVATASLVQAFDGGYALAGTIGRSSASNIWVAKTNSLGNLQWSKTRGGAFADQGVSVVQTSDGGYAVSGDTYYSDEPYPDSDFLLLKMDANGNIQWTKTYGEQYVYGLENKCGQVIQTKEGGYAFVGTTGESYEEAWYKGVLIKTDKGGIVQWSHTYFFTPPDSGLNSLSSLVQTWDRGYALVGRTEGWLTDIDQPTIGMWLVRTDALGNDEPLPLFADGFESGSFSKWNSITKTSGETAVVTGVRSHSGYYSAKFASNGGSGSEAACSNKLLPSSNELYARAYFYVSQSGIVQDEDRFHLITIGAGTTNVAFASWRKTAGVLKWSLVIRDGTGPNWPTVYSSTTPKPNTWYCVELHWKRGVANGMGELFVNGVRVCSITGRNTSSFGNATRASFGLAGLMYCGQTTVCCDAAEVSPARIGPEAGIFHDGFDSASLGSWTGKSMSLGETAAVTSTMHHHGSYSARFTSNGQGGSEYAYCHKSIPSSSDLFAGGSFYVSRSGIADNGDRMDLLTFKSGSNTVASAGWIRTGGTTKWFLSIRHGTINTFTYASQGPATGRWYSVEVHWRKDSVNGFGELWINGVRVCVLVTKNTSFYGNANKVCFGLPLLINCGSSTVYCDCCAISNTRIGPS